jgi:dihydropteroate synthase
MSEEYLQCGRYRLPVGEAARPLVMGVLNSTPDSFSDGGEYLSLDAALSRAEQMIAEGVDIIDIGGESSRPGAPPLPLEEELRRVMPLVYALRDCGKPLSVDTYKPEVMREVLSAGADMINDIRGFGVPGALTAINGSECGICIMHMQNNPQTMQVDPQYDNVVAEVSAFLGERVAAMTASGVSHERICVDPGFGFGKTLAHNMALLNNLESIRQAVGRPVLAGLSRKSMIGAITGKAVQDRQAGSVAAAMLAAIHGARIVRVHDVGQSVDALKVWQAVRIAPA